MQLPKGDHVTARAHREWLRRVLEQTGIPPTTLAKRAGIHPSTLTRPLAEGETGTSTLHATTIAKLVALTGLPPPAIPGAPLGRPPIGFLEDAVRYSAEGHDALAGAIRALTAGRPNADPWVLKTRALELEGYMPGDVVIVDLAQAPEPGEPVCAQVYDWPKMKAETVMRLFQRAGPVNLLVARSLDPSFDKPLVVDGERVVIKGVILPHRLRPKAAA